MPDTGKDMEKLKHSSSAVGMQNGTTTLKKSFWFLEQLNTHLTWNLGLPLLRVYARAMKAQASTKIDTWMFIAALFILSKNY